MSWADKDLQYLRDHYVALDLNGLRDLRDALDAMEVKELCRHEYISNDGTCCGIGALAIWKGITPEALKECMRKDDVIAKIGIPKQLHEAIVFANDNAHSEETPEERWQGMRKWVDEQLGNVA